jgi:hypothetical protein
MLDYTRISAELDRRLRNWNVEVTPHAKDIIIQSILAIGLDQNPEWNPPITPAMIDSVQLDVIAASSLKLAGLYQRMANRMPSPRPITTFDVLHSISTWVDDLCPFEKPGTP